MSSNRAVVEEFRSCSSRFETVRFASTLAMPPNISLRLRTSCSAGRSAGLYLFALSFNQKKADMYYRKEYRRGGEVSRKVALWQVL